MGKSKKLKTNKTSQRLIRLAEAYKAERCSRTFEFDAPVLIELEGVEEPLFAVSTAHEELGETLLILRGNESYHNFVEVTRTNDRQAFLAIRLLHLSYERRGDILPQFQTILKQAGVQVPASQRVPFLFARDPFHDMRPLRSAEMRLLSSALRALLDYSRSPDSRGSSALDPSAQIVRIRVDARGDYEGGRRIELPDELRVGLVANQVALPEELAELPRLTSEHSVLCVPIRALIQNDDRVVSAFLVLDSTSGEIIAHETLLGEEANVPPNVWTRLFRGEFGPGHQRGLPNRVIFASSTLFDSACASLTDLGVRAELDPEHPSFGTLSEQLATLLGDLDPVESEIPEEPVTADEWRAVCGNLTRKMCTRLGDIDTPQTRKRYFGMREIPALAIERFGEEVVRESYFEWLLKDYRRTKRSKTEVEQWLLRDDLTPAERVILKAHRDAILSQFRVKETTVGESLTVIDIFSQKEYRLHDRALSRSVDPGLILLLRVFALGDWHYCGLAGPPLTGYQATQAMDGLLNMVEKGRGDLRRAATDIGRLWEFFATPAPAPILQNTDGDSLEPQTLQFSYQDRRTLESCLRERSDVEANGKHRFTWLRREPNPKLGGAPTVLGSLELKTRQLAVDVNSKARARRIREWLERIPGVRYLQTQAGELPDFRRSPASAPPETLSFSPDEVGALADHFRRQILGWLDAPIPALGDRTPREACKQEEGRRRVVHLIQTMPNPAGNPGLSEAIDFENIRMTMLRELGLDASVE